MEIEGDTKHRRQNRSCAYSYHNVNGVCRECPSGTYGVACRSTCPTGFYGRLCREECGSCWPCDPIHGCFSGISDSTNETLLPKTLAGWSIFGIVAACIMLIVIVIIITFQVRKRAYNGTRNRYKVEERHLQHIFRRKTRRGSSQLASISQKLSNHRKEDRSYQFLDIQSSDQTLSRAYADLNTRVEIPMDVDGYLTSADEMSVLHSNRHVYDDVINEDSVHGNTSSWKDDRSKSSSRTKDDRSYQFLDISSEKIQCQTYSDLHPTEEIQMSGDGYLTSADAMSVLHSEHHVNDVVAEKSDIGQHTALRQ